MLADMMSSTPQPSGDPLPLSGPFLECSSPDGFGAVGVDGQESHGSHQGARQGQELHRKASVTPAAEFSRRQSLGSPKFKHPLFAEVPVSSGGHICDLVARGKFGTQSETASYNLPGHILVSPPGRSALVGAVESLRDFDKHGLTWVMSFEKLAASLAYRMELFLSSRVPSAGSGREGAFLARAREVFWHQNQASRVRRVCECYVGLQEIAQRKVWRKDESQDERRDRLGEFWPRFHEDCRILAMASVPDQVQGKKDAPDHSTPLHSPQLTNRIKLDTLKQPSWKGRQARSRCSYQGMWDASMSPRAITHKNEQRAEASPHRIKLPPLDQVGVDSKQTSPIASSSRNTTPKQGKPAPGQDQGIMGLSSFMTPAHLLEEKRPARQNCVSLPDLHAHQRLPRADHTSTFTVPWRKRDKITPFTESDVRGYIQKCRNEALAPSLLPFVTGHSPKLNACGQDLVDNDLNAVIAMVKPQLITEIHLQDNARLSDKAMESFLQAVAKQPPVNLFHLNLSRCVGIGIGALGALRDLLQNAKNLQQLSLSGIRIGVKAQHPLCKAIRAHPRLHEVDLAEMGLTDNIVAKRCLEELVNSSSIQSLDLSWNCFSAEVFGHFGKVLEDAPMLTSLKLANCSAEAATEKTTPVMVFMEHLVHCDTLTCLDLSLNRIDFRGALILEDSLASHRSLRDLNVANNPLGTIGTRALLRMMMQATSPLATVNWESCSQGVSMSPDTNVFRATNPGGRYALDLSQPYDRAFLRMLYKCCDRLGVPPEAAFVDLVYNPTYRHPPRSDDGIWRVPSQGKLQFTFTLERASEGSLAGVDEQDFSGFLERYMQTMRLQPYNRKVVPVLGRWRLLRGILSEQRVLLDALSKDFSLTYPVLSQLCDQDEISSDVVWRLLASLIGGKVPQHLTLMILPSVKEALWVVKQASAFLTFNPENPSGQYQLDLASPPDYAVLERLLLIDRWEAGIQKYNRRAETSQHGDSTHLRNVKYQSQPLTASLPRWHVPEHGFFECDYSSSKRPPSQTECTLGKEHYHDIMTLMHRSDCQPKHKVTALRSISHRIYVSADQVREVLGIVPSPEARIDLVVLLFHRLIDPQNDKIFRARFQDSQEVESLMYRLGYLTFFPYAQPEQASFELDFHYHDQRLAANLLVFSLAAKEGEGNLKQVSFTHANGIKDSLPNGVPRLWHSFDRMPTSGVLRASYTCSPEDRHFDVRKRLLKTYGKWCNNLEEKDVTWVASVCEVPRELLDYSKFLRVQFSDMTPAFHAIDGKDGNGTISFTKLDASMKILECNLFEGPNEALRLQTIFRYLDRNTSGALSIGEWLVLDLLFQEVRRAVLEFYYFVRRTFRNGDLNLAWEYFTQGTGRAGRVTEEEWCSLSKEAGHFGPVKPVFLYLDKDSKGVLSWEDFNLLSEAE